MAERVLHRLSQNTQSYLKMLQPDRVEAAEEYDDRMRLHAAAPSSGKRGRPSALATAAATVTTRSSRSKPQGSAARSSRPAHGSVRSIHPKITHQRAVLPAGGPPALSACTTYLTCRRVCPPQSRGTRWCTFQWSGCLSPAPAVPSSPKGMPTCYLARLLGFYCAKPY